MNIIIILQNVFESIVLFQLYAGGSYFRLVRPYVMLVCAEAYDLGEV